MKLLGRSLWSTLQNILQNNLQNTLQNYSRLPPLWGGLALRGGGAVIGTLNQLDEIVRIFRVEEIIFCSKDIRSQDILSWMTRLGPAVSYKIVPEESLSIIGSSSKNEPGELYTIEIRYNIAQPGQRRNKRMQDLLICGALLLTFPVWMLFSGKRKLFARNWWAVLRSAKTWVGYAVNPQNSSLPKLKPGVFSPLDALRGLNPTESAVTRLNFLYAKDWNAWRDLEILLKSSATNS